MAAAPIDCQHCARTVLSQRPKQAKWCPTCRTLKSIIALGTGRPVKCLLCDERFHRAERHQSLCPGCSVGLHSDADLLHEPCRICGTADVHGFEQDELSVCYRCVGEVKGDTHKRVLRAATKRLAQLQSNPPREPALNWRDGRPVV